MDTLNFVDEEGKEQGLWKIYHDNGQLDLEGSFVDGKHHGLFHYYDEEGRLECKGFYDHGIHVGDWREFYPNGELKSLTKYNNEGLILNTVSYYTNLDLWETACRFETTDYKNDVLQQYQTRGKNHVV